MSSESTCSSIDLSNSETSSTINTTLTESSGSERQNLDLRGDILENYNIISELGNGAYSRVWLGYDISDGKYYAIKVQNADDYEDAKDEIKILKKIGNNSKYINRIHRNFTESRFVEGEINKYACSVFELCAGNLDGLSRKGKYKNGYPPKLVKQIFKQICLGIKCLHNDIKVFHGDIKPDNILICGINNKDKKYMNDYSSADFKDIYKKVKTQYWIQKGKNVKNIKKMDQETRQKIRRKIHTSIISNLGKNDESRYHIDNKYLEDLNIKVTDFGHFCPDDEMMEDDFGTKYYQAPEIVLMGNCTKKVDIWALGCTLYELLTGNILFDLKKDNELSEDYIHLKEIINICGNFNREFLRTTKFHNEFFDKNGNLYDYKYNNTNSTEQILKEKLVYDNVTEDVDKISHLLAAMLTMPANRRLSIDKILEHPWLA